MFLKAFLAQSKTGATSAMSVRTARPALKMPASKRCSLDRFSSSSNGRMCRDGLRWIGETLSSWPMLLRRAHAASRWISIRNYHRRTMKTNPKKLPRVLIGRERRRPETPLGLSKNPATHLQRRHHRQRLNRKGLIAQNSKSRKIPTGTGTALS